jgi:hypothetical protein
MPSIYEACRGEPLDPPTHFTKYLFLFKSKYLVKFKTKGVKMKEKKRKLTIRLNEDDYNKLIIQAKRLGVSQVQLVRELIRKNMISDIKECNLWLDDIRKSIRSLSNNMNQIAKKINSKIFLDEVVEIQKIQEKVKRIWQLLK